jgi:hypothetical protein
MKIINITYGLKGENTKKYTYLVNDNVRNGQVVFPNVKHHSSGKIYGTVGVVQNSYNPNSKNGRNAVNELEANGKNLTGTAITGKGAINQMGSISKTQKGENGLYVGTETTVNNYDTQKKENPYIENRKATTAKDRVDSEYQTADEYISQFEYNERGGR